jgi:hypothetical protein
MTIPAAQAMLAKALLQTPRLALASVVTWLDPLGLLNLDSQDFENDGDDLPVALLACRASFPDVYAQSLLALAHGASLAELERIICFGASQHLVVSIEDIEMFKWGVPCEGLGIDLNGYYQDMALEEAYPRLMPVLNWLGLSHTSTQTECAYTYNTASQLVKSLDCFPENTPHRDLANLLRWILGESGNTLVDNIDEMLYESGLEPMEWTPDNVAFMNEVQTEAYQIVESAMRALERLEHDTDWREALQSNCKRLTERKSKRVPLRWPSCAGGSASNAAHTPA